MGVLTLSPLLAIGPAPNPGTKQFATYEYAQRQLQRARSVVPRRLRLLVLLRQRGHAHRSLGAHPGHHRVGAFDAAEACCRHSTSPCSTRATRRNGRDHRAAGAEALVHQQSGRLQHVCRSDRDDARVGQSRRSDGAAVRRQRAAALQRHLRSRRLHRVELEPDQRHRYAVRELLPAAERANVQRLLPSPSAPRRQPAPSCPLRRRRPRCRRPGAGRRRPATPPTAWPSAT